MKKLIFTLFMSLMTFTTHAQSTLLGDVNEDGKVTVADVMMVVNIIMKGYAPFSVDPTSVSMPVGGTATLEIQGGYDQYEVISANTAVVEASLDGTTITLTAIASGETKVFVKDVKTQRIVEIPVSVEYALLQLSASELSLVAGDESMVEITSGSDSYSVESSDETVATATIQDNAVTVTAVGAGTATITVTDTKVNETASIEVTVTAPLCPDDHHPHLIDLGLPSGTKWACCNVGADKPEASGDFYAWGETETKTTYDWSTYIHCDGSSETCHNLGGDIAGTEYDVAHVNWGGPWVMPTKEQQDELSNNCTYEWTTVNGVEGGKYTSKTNGGSIFLPAAGRRYDSDLSYASAIGYYWSSTQDLSYADCADFLGFHSVYTGTNYESRVFGFTVRPVVPPFSLSAGPLLLSTGDESTVSITSGSGSYSVESSDTGVATAVVDGTSVKITAVGAGTATITVTDTKSSQTATIEVTVSSASLCPDDNHPHMIDLGLPSGTLWSCCNVDTDHLENQSPTNYGGYYAWGETETKSYYDPSTYIHCDGTVDTCHDLGECISGTEYDVAHVKWGGTWQIPTLDQCGELKDNCIYSWTTINGINGGVFTGKNGERIFLPAAGLRVPDNPAYIGDTGFYFTGVSDGGMFAGSFWISNGGADCVNYYRYNGDTMRPVAGPMRPSSSVLNLIVGEERCVNISSGSGNFSVQSSDESIATATAQGSSVIVAAVKVGTATLTVTDKLSGLTAIIELTVSGYLCPDDHHPHLIDLGLPSGTKWACCNVDTDHPENQSPTNYGGYYAWGETETKSTYDWSSYIHCDGSENTCHNLGSDIAGTQYDVAHVKWGGSWVMPTNAQTDELYNNCTYEWTIVNGVEGGKYTSKANGGSIFLPAAGGRNGSGLYDAGSVGFYWSSTLDPSNSYSRLAHLLVFFSDYTHWGGSDRFYGQGVRPVVRN